jgi:hypothetical protein
LSKVEELKALRNARIQTIETGAVRDITSKSGSVYMYTDLNAHGGNGRLVMRKEEACLIYPNTLASEFYVETGTINYYIVHVGKRQFTVKIDSALSNNKNRGVDYVKELKIGYCDTIKFPVYSIKFIVTSNGKLLASSLNNVPNLFALGIDSVMSAGDVMTEIGNAIVKFK